jgi:hypothetical protein
VSAVISIVGIERARVRRRGYDAKRVVLRRIGITRMAKSDMKWRGLMVLLEGEKKDVRDRRDE